ncbi:erythropoietin-like [Scyliorhinus canicula]|uniref:erythropoietin-like n=1 Tax=Scyliorhinus canicula TaxID=7830 RepID=UPI0018F2DA42|nr:erythropoietin-like [Scyliorhinus canicula]
MDLTSHLLLLMCLVQTRLAKMIPSRPLCDSRIMDRYIREAKELLNAPCNRIFQFPNAIPLPNTGLNLRIWRSKSKRMKNEEIKAGLIMLSNATQAAKQFITNNSTVRLLDKIYRNTRTFIHILQLMNVPDTSTQLYGRRKPFMGRTVQNVLYTYTRLMRGKINIFYREMAEEYCKPRQR